MVSHRSTVLLGVAVCLALLGAASRGSPLFLDGVARSVELIARAPFILIFVVALLILTAAAGAWATLLGIKDGKHVRTGRRRKTRRY